MYYNMFAKIFSYEPLVYCAHWDARDAASSVHTLNAKKAGGRGGREGDWEGGREGREGREEGKPSFLYSLHPGRYFSTPPNAY